MSNASIHTSNQKANTDGDQENGQHPNKGVTQTATTSFVMDREARRAKKAKGAFLTISEVADKLDVQQHVLRFWETKFNQVKPLKRGGGRRYYRPEDVALLERIHHLLYTEGYTIKGVQKLLKGQGKAQIIEAVRQQNQVQAQTPTVAAAGLAPEIKETQTVDAVLAKQKMSDQQRAVLEVMLGELKSMRQMLNVS